MSRRAVFFAALLAVGPAVYAGVDFNREIRPLLNAHCLKCHGGVKEAGGLNLQFRDQAIQAGESGEVAIVPGKPEASAFIERLTTDDAEDRMPRKEPPLPKEKVDLLRRWIAEGAPWGKHWAYEPPVRGTLPLDAAISARLQADGLSFSPEADLRTLARRMSLDITGLPPEPERVDALEQAAARDRESALSGYVDELLASPAYGERWAAPWLDLARYADSRGYEKDGFRDMWPYRDWVVRALNQDLPYDRFLTEQLAGDLLPQRTEDQIVATAFHRNTPQNDEGGTDDEEFRTYAVLDRLNTTFDALQGTSIGCVQCHGHPYDAFRHREYYELLAFFNNTADADCNDQAPTYKYFPPEEAKIATALTAQMARAEREIAAARKSYEPLWPAWLAARQELALVTPEKGPDKAAADLASILIRDQKAWKPEERSRVDRQFLAEVDPASAPLYQQFDRDKAALGKVTKADLPIMEELTGKAARVTRIFHRGNWMDKANPVEPKTPSVLNPWPDGAPRNRLGFAQWLTNGQNPLTARVQVNRIWEQLFGIGLVETLEDFGSQGDAPRYREVLDDLAVRFETDLGWSQKKLIRLVLLSQVYRQTSRVSAELSRRDPANRLLARGPRFRLSSEQLRDQALALGGLLSAKMGGPSVMPYQPPGVWQTPYEGRDWTTAPGEDGHRRALYTFIRRSATYPSMVTFDAPNREFCVVRRLRTNTPLQALDQLNSPVFMEAAAGLAARMTGPTLEAQIARGLALATLRPARSYEIEALSQLHARTGGNLRLVANAILNLDEVQNKN